MKLLYWQHRCMAYTPPPDSVVYDSTTDGFVPPPIEWSRFYMLYSPPGFNSRGTVFLHEMHEPHKPPRLVAVDVELLAFLAHRNLVLFPRVVAPVGMFNLTTKPDWGSGWCGDLPNDFAPFKVFSGTLDPSDAAHFTIRMQRGDRDFYFDGWLQDDRLFIEPRQRPLRH